MAGLLEAVADIAGRVRFIFDYEAAHPRSSGALWVELGDDDASVALRSDGWPSINRLMERASKPTTIVPPVLSSAIAGRPQTIYIGNRRAISGTGQHDLAGFSGENRRLSVKRGKPPW